MKFLKKNLNFEQVMNPPLKKVKKKNKNKKNPFPISFSNFSGKYILKTAFIIRFMYWYIQKRKQKKERLSLSLACDERFVSTDTLWLHGQAFDVLYEMSEPQRICLHLTILRKKISYHFLTSSHPLSLSLTLSPLKSSVSLSFSLSL